jgi:hypothetical protein
MSSVHDQVLECARELMSKEAKKLPLGKRLKRGAILGGAGLATVSAATGAAKAVKNEPTRPMAPPNQVPPGY